MIFIGHGTFVSSQVAGQNYGVLKNAQIYAVKVLDDNGDGDLFSIEAGIMQVIETSQLNASRRSIASMSLGGPQSTAFDNAVNTLLTNNIVTVVSAGNSGQDAVTFSPADLGCSTNIITVGASDINDFKPSWSNYGSCVTISAPGNAVPGAWYTSDTATNVLSGTSMSCPYVSGVAGLVLQQDLTLSILQVKTFITQWATQDIVDFTSNNGGGKNLLYSLIDITQTPPPTTMAPPTLPPVPSPNFELKGNHIHSTIHLLLLLLSILLYYML